MYILAFRKSGALGVPTVALKGETTDDIFNYSCAHGLEFMPCSADGLPVIDVNQETESEGD
jgi:hypothetical protein